MKKVLMPLLLSLTIKCNTFLQKSLRSYLIFIIDLVVFRILLYLALKVRSTR